MEYFSSYLFILFALKVVFIMMAISSIYLKFKHRENSEIYKIFFYWKERVEFIFVFLMACLLIYLFFPSSNKSVEISGATKELLYLFGIVVLVTAKWGEFCKESPAFIRLQSIIGINY